jgi:hypothetical protein
VSEGLLEALAANGVSNAKNQMIDSTVIQAHRHSAGAMKEGAIRAPPASLTLASALRFMC